MQTNIDQFFKACKRPASDELPGISAKLVARKLFHCDKELKPSTPDFAEARNNANEEAEKLEEQPVEEEETQCTPTTSPTSQALLRKKLNIGEFRKVVRRNKKYTSLKEKLEKFNNTKERLKDIEESLKEVSTPQLQRFNHLEVEVPSSPVKCGNLKPRRLFWTSPCKSPAKSDFYVSPKKLLDEARNKTPVKASFEKFNRLLASGKEPLILPHKYLVLKEIFRAMDVITKIKSNRGSMTFDELQKEVQKMLRRNFSQQHLGKVRTIYPESYECVQECVKDSNTRAEKSELVVKRLNHSASDDEFGTEFTNTHRLKIFHDRLLQRTKTLHQEFLKNLDPPIIVDVDKITIWHPEFQLENVLDIEATALPEPPNAPINMSAKYVLLKTHEMISVNHRMEKAIAAITEKEKTSENVPKPTTPSTPNPIPALQKALKGIPKSILEKVRAKQAAKMAEKLTQTPAEAKEAVMMSRLPELARIMRNVFVNKKKGVLPVDIVMSNISFSYKEKLSQNELLQHLKLISKHVPGWMNFYVVHNTDYIRLSKDADMTRIVGKLQNLANPA